MEHTKPWRVCQVCRSWYWPAHTNYTRARTCPRCRPEVKRVREWLRRENGRAPKWATILRQLRQEGVTRKRRAAVRRRRGK